MKNALILHGGDNNSQGNWFPWLKKELEKKGYKVWSPDLPNSSHPQTKDWLEAIFSNKDWVFNEESVIIGHSAGAAIILRILENLPKDIKIKKAILVAGYVELGNIPEYFKYKEGIIEGGFNWDKIRNSSLQFYFIASDNDQYLCGADQAKIMQKHLGGELLIKPGEQHFNLEKGPEYKQFPFLLTLID